MQPTDDGGRWSMHLVVLVAIAVGAVACDRSMPTIPPTPPPDLAVVSAPVSDRVMGSLSGLARHVSLALRDPAVRGAVIQAMKDPTARGSGLDLTNCQAGTVVHRLFAAGEQQGGSPAATVCAAAAAKSGLMLYMAPDRLAHWDSTLVPIVTAVADPRSPLPASFQGYRSPDQMIEIPRDGSLRGPILVVLPILHPTRYAGRPARLLPTHAIQVHLSASDTGRVGAPAVQLRPSAPSGQP